jgi:hypothetical protein
MILEIDKQKLISNAINVLFGMADIDKLAIVPAWPDGKEKNKGFNEKKVNP